MNKQEIEKLKDNWLCDPCWDIEETEGFEEHRDELLAFRKEWEAKWKMGRQHQLEKKAAKIGVPGNIKLAQYIEGLEFRIEELERAEEARKRNRFIVR